MGRLLAEISHGEDIVFGRLSARHRPGYHHWSYGGTISLGVGGLENLQSRPLKFRGLVRFEPNLRLKIAAMFRLLIDLIMRRSSLT